MQEGPRGPLGPGEVDEAAPGGVSTDACSFGGVAEWSKATVLKTVGRKLRGFESLLLLQFPGDP